MEKGFPARGRSSPSPASRSAWALRKKEQLRRAKKFMNKIRWPTIYSLSRNTVTRLVEKNRKALQEQTNPLFSSKAKAVCTISSVCHSWKDQRPGDLPCSRSQCWQASSRQVRVFCRWNQGGNHLWEWLIPPLSSQETTAKLFFHEGLKMKARNRFWHCLRGLILSPGVARQSTAGRWDLK